MSKEDKEMASCLRLGCWAFLFLASFQFGGFIFHGRVDALIYGIATAFCGLVVWGATGSTITTAENNDQ